ncbi:LOB domain-containing protein 21-like [Cucurbita moschata]|uniref:LOB domain-containing protein 21-like n=1 Tax=Cucurbita moschata TaxID=3662 RepID=A0A6J1GN41_CUCMO|nr:LOB domain-containing protein 21-like [Cucurbita moschata]
MRGCHDTRSSSSCAACKLLKRRCTPTCIFAPYFRSDEPKKFAKVHKVFGASNVSKILTEVPEEQREDTVNSLAYEAEARLRDPVYGCIGAIALLQTKMAELQHDLALAKARLARYAAANNNNTSSTSLGVLENCVVNMSYGGLSFSGQSSDDISQYGFLCDFTHFPYPFQA